MICVHSLHGSKVSAITSHLQSHIIDKLTQPHTRLHHLSQSASALPSLYSSQAICSVCQQLHETSLSTVRDCKLLEAPWWFLEATSRLGSSETTASISCLGVHGVHLTDESWVQLLVSTVWYNFQKVHNSISPAKIFVRWLWNFDSIDISYSISSWYPSWFDSKSSVFSKRISKIMIGLSIFVSWNASVGIVKRFKHLRKLKRKCRHRKSRANITAYRCYFTDTVKMLKESKRD